MVVTMKILQIVKTNDGAVWAYKQAKRLSEMGVEMICMLPSSDGKMSDAYREAKIKVIAYDAALPLKNPIKFCKMKKEFNDLINNINPDIIHTHFVTNALFSRWALGNKHIPRIFQVPGPLHLEKTFYRKLDIYTSKKNLDYWIPTCQYSYNTYINEGIDEAHVKLIYYGGYGGNTLDEYRDNTNKLHDKFKIARKVKLVGMVSYFYKPSVLKGQRRGIKGHEDFFDAMEIITKKHHDVKAIVIGGPWNQCYKYEKKLKKYAIKKLGKNVIFTGFRTDLKQIYRELAIAVHPSHSENLGGAAESLAAGVPTIATNIGGFPDIIINGKTGLLVEKASPKLLAEAIDNMLNNYANAKNMAMNGKKYVGELLDIEKTCNDIYEFYKDILEKRT